MTQSKAIKNSSSKAPLQTTDILVSVHVSEASESECKTTALCQTMQRFFFFHSSRVAAASIELFWQEVNDRKTFFI